MANENRNAGPLRNLVLVLGDQLDRNSAAFDNFGGETDAVLMMEVDEEATYIPQHKIRLVLFFAAMRHFRDELRERGKCVHYVELTDRANTGSFATEIERQVKALQPEKLVLIQPGDHRVEQIICKLSKKLKVALEIREDRHFLCTTGEFADFADARKSLLQETFYREMRRRHDILMNGDEPLGGNWNFDADNRDTFGKDGPGQIKAPRSFRPDEITRTVIDMVERRYPEAPGSLTQFDYPVTHEQARAALRDFIQHRLANFGRYQDAMVTGHPYLYHSRLSCVLNLHLLQPKAAIELACAAHDEGEAPLNAVEGFVRQILGWREYIRGVYWWQMPGYAELNALDADRPMPAFMWTSETEMNCVRHCVGQLVEHAYTHHIQRLMVLGLYAMLLGVRPYDVHRWHLSMHADAIDWVSLPNVLGMSQYGDGGIVGTKPYSASGNYISRMSDYCQGCRYNPRQASGDSACPFTTLYWDFLQRNEDKLKDNRRMQLQLRNLARKDHDERQSIRKQAERIIVTATRHTYL